MLTAPAEPWQRRRLAAVSAVVTKRSRAHAAARFESLRTHSGAKSILANAERRLALRRSYRAYCHAVRSSLEKMALDPEGPPPLR